VDVDPHILSRTLANLLDNALKFTRKKGYVSLKTSSKRDACSDRPARRMLKPSAGQTERLFDAFEQRGADRTGLGGGYPNRAAPNHANPGARAGADSCIGVGTVCVPAVAHYVERLCMGVSDLSGPVPGSITTSAVVSMPTFLGERLRMSKVRSTSDLRIGERCTTLTFPFALQNANAVCLRSSRRRRAKHQTASLQTAAGPAGLGRSTSCSNRMGIAVSRGPVVLRRRIAGRKRLRRRLVGWPHSASSTRRSHGRARSKQNATCGSTRAGVRREHRRRRAATTRRPRQWVIDHASADCSTRPSRGDEFSDDSGA
jgi:hypothetical protein